MSFWVIALSVAGLVAALLALAMNRSRLPASDGGHDLQVYKDQLTEVGRDQERGVISHEDAERSRLEISRRLLDADKLARDSHMEKSGRFNLLASGLVAVAVLGGTFMLYLQLGAPNYPDLPLQTRLQQAEDIRATRPAQNVAEAEVNQGRPAANADPQHLELIDKLRRALKERSDDLQGYILLARNEATLGNFTAAHQALNRILAIKGTAAAASDFADYADMLVLAAGGYVSPLAEQALSNALSLDPDNGTAQYYTGLMFAQTGRPDLAFRIWRPLYEDSAPDAPWVYPISQQIEQVAADAGTPYRLADQPVPPGPDAGQISDAKDLSAEEREQMIRAMVSRLSDRLASEGGSPDEWARLINALGVLGEQERAAMIWKEAQAVFQNTPSAVATIRAAANRIGLAE